MLFLIKPCTVLVMKLLERTQGTLLKVPKIFPYSFYTREPQKKKGQPLYKGQNQ